MYFAFISLAHSPRTVQPHSDRVAVRLLALLFAITSSRLHTSPSPPTHHPPRQYQGQSLRYNALSLQDSLHYTDGIDISGHLLPWDLNERVPRMTATASRMVAVGDARGVNDWGDYTEGSGHGFTHGVGRCSLGWHLFFFISKIFITFKVGYVMYSYQAFLV